jgi:Kef-type K+ transport system membrane component KefB
MSVTILFVALVVFAFFAAHLINRYASRIVPVSGAEYLVIGALIGPQIPMRVLTTESLAQLTPLISLLLGLSGFLVGLQATRTFHDVRSSLVGLGVALSTLLGLSMVFAALYGWLVPPAEVPLVQTWLYEFQGFHVELLLTRPQVATGVVLAAAATVTFSASLSGLEGDRLVDVPAYRLLRSCAFYGQLVAISAVAAVLAWSRSRAVAVVELPAGGWFAGVLLLGVVLGVCFTVFIGREQSTSRIFVATVGTVTFGAGVGAELGVSPMFVNLVAGATVALTSRHRENLRRELKRLQHPISVLLLVLTGALWVPPESSLLWFFPLVYLASRWLARMTLPGLLTRVLTHIDPTRIGVGLLSQGTLAVAVAVDYALQAPEQAGIVLTTAIVGTLVFDVFAQGALKRYLIDAEAENATAIAPTWARHEADA